jgi:hypothetical protein
LLTAHRRLGDQQREHRDRACAGDPGAADLQRRVDLAQITRLPTLEAHGKRSFQRGEEKRTPVQRTGWKDPDRDRGGGAGHLRRIGRSWR